MNSILYNNFFNLNKILIHNLINYNSMMTFIFSKKLFLIINYFIKNIFFQIFKYSK